MAVKVRVERPVQTIKSNVTPISQDVKTKIANAFSEFVNAVKAKHLG
jgi:hypothetical protein